VAGTGGRAPGGIARQGVERLLVLRRRGRLPGLRTAKTVLAAVLSFVVADAMGTSSSPVLAPLTALLVVHLTMYETLANGRERIVSVVAGVLVALLFANLTGLNWWSLGLVVAFSLVLGRALRLGPHLPEVPISAMLVLAVGGAEPVALGRVVETLVGAVVGVLVNLLIAPPLYILPASDAIDELAERMADFCDDLAAALRAEWSRQTAERQLSRARLLGRDVARADRHLARTEESARLNPRGRQARDAQPRLRSTLTALEHVQVGLRSLGRVLLDRTFFVPEDEADRAYAPETRAALADVLAVVATALRKAAHPPSTSEGAPSDEDVEAILRDLRSGRDRLAALLVVDPVVDPAAWAQHGALLDAVDRLRVEAEAALRPAYVSWSPAPLAERQRQVLRQAMNAATTARRGFRLPWRRREES
jgi:uncharacterized membrane protein YgaE (UPF0421/DUF939 family)